MNLPRMLRALQIMEEVQAKGKPFQMERYLPSEGDPWACNTPACMMGWCMRDKGFQAEGLKARENKLFVKNKVFWEPLFAHRYGIYATMEFFNIDLSQANWLTMPEMYRDEVPEGEIEPKHVIARLQTLIADPDFQPDLQDEDLD